MNFMFSLDATQNIVHANILKLKTGKTSCLKHFKPII